MLGLYDVRRIGPCLLIVMVALWGGPPGYANSYALADLPWHQVNPSALAFALAVFALGWFERMRRSPRSGVRAKSVAMTMVACSHFMRSFYARPVRNGSWPKSWRH